MACGYIDPNPISSLNNKGHNYFLSQNPYVLNSYAAFGEAYYSMTAGLKLTGGLALDRTTSILPIFPAKYCYESTAIRSPPW